MPLPDEFGVQRGERAPRASYAWALRVFAATLTPAPAVPDLRFLSGCGLSTTFDRAHSGKRIRWPEARARTKVARLTAGACDRRRDQAQLGCCGAVAASVRRTRPQLLHLPIARCGLPRASTSTKGSGAPHSQRRAASRRRMCWSGSSATGSMVYTIQMSSGRVKVESSSARVSSVAAVRYSVAPVGRAGAVQAHCTAHWEVDGCACVRARMRRRSQPASLAHSSKLDGAAPQPNQGRFRSRTERAHAALRPSKADPPSGCVCAWHLIVWA